MISLWKFYAMLVSMLKMLLLTLMLELAFVLKSDLTFIVDYAGMWLIHFNPRNVELVSCNLSENSSFKMLQLSFFFELDVLLVFPLLLILHIPNGAILVLWSFVLLRWSFLMSWCSELSKSELRISQGLKSAGVVSDICDGENLWQWSRL